MTYLTEADLRGYAASPLAKSAARSNVRSSREVAETSIFLSHSHLDRDLAVGLINYLASHGLQVYVDWNDSEMPRITNRTTAEKIKSRIRVNRFFMILATRNAVASRWVPWETGIADQSKGEEHIVLVPIADPNGRFDGSEYLQLYRRVSSADSGEYGIFPPGKQTGVLLEDHIREFA
jgi:TIR domain